MQDYHLFVTVVERGSLSAAGRALHISPAMVSKRLARLEQRLDAALITRTTRRLALTPAGERFYADAQAILNAVAAAEARVAGQLHEASGPLRVNAPTSFGRMHVAPHLARFLEEHPRIELELNLSDGFIDLMDDRTDMAIRITGNVGPGLEAIWLADNRRILCASPAYLAAHGVPVRFSDLSGHRLLAAEGQLPWRMCDSDGRRRDVMGISHVRTNSSEVVREMAIAGIGIAFRSLWDIAPQVRGGDLVQILPDLEGVREVGIQAVYPKASPLTAAARSFIDYLRPLFSPLPPWEKPGG